MDVGGMDEEETMIRKSGDSEALTAYLDKKYPRMSEPDEEGIYLHPEDPRRRFIMTCEGVTFYNPGPITEEEKAEVEHMLKMMAGEEDSSPGKEKDKKQKTHR